MLEDLEHEDREEVLSKLPTFERLSLKRSLDFPEDSAGRRMQTDFIAIPPFWTVGQTIDYLRTEQDLPDEFYQIYVVDASYQVLGTISLDKFLRSRRETQIEAMMNTNVILVDADEDQEEAARDFERYDLVEVGVVDESRRLVGVLTIDDMVDVIHEEADEDIKLLAGVGDEDISDSPFDTVKSRAPWLVVNLITAVTVSLVIGLFNAHHRADGGSGRADADRRLDGRQCRHPDDDGDGARAGDARTGRAQAAAADYPRNAGRVDQWGDLRHADRAGDRRAFRSCRSGPGHRNGHDHQSGRGRHGGDIDPPDLDKLKADPAVASSVFVTMITDMVGFFAFLGIAALWFGLL